MSAGRSALIWTNPDPAEPKMEIDSVHNMPKCRKEPKLKRAQLFWWSTRQVWWRRAPWNWMRCGISTLERQIIWRATQCSPTWRNRTTGSRRNQRRHLASDRTCLTKAETYELTARSNNNEKLVVGRADRWSRDVNPVHPPRVLHRRGRPNHRARVPARHSWIYLIEKKSEDFDCF